ncbi:13297_t:CDS:2, partial [Funneliformis mosseae]
YGNWAYTSESFIYSLGNGKDSKNFNISRVRDSNYAMYESHYVNMTLNFGNSDLVINGNTAQELVEELGELPYEEDDDRAVGDRVRDPIGKAGYRRNNCQ